MKKTKIIIGIFLAVIGVLAVGFVVFCIITIQGLSSPVLAVLTSPVASQNEVWLLEDGFVDRGISLFIKSPSLNNGKPKRITSLDWDGLYCFKKVQWSQDGDLAVFSLLLAEGDWPEVTAFAFDFSTGTAVLPSWQGKNTTSKKSAEEWKKHELTIAELAKTHKGLTSKGLAGEDFRKKSQKLWFWQMPKE